MYLIMKENEKKKTLSIVKIDGHTKSNQLVGKRNKFTFFEVDITFCSTFFPTIFRTMVRNLKLLVIRSSDFARSVQSICK